MLIVGLFECLFGYRFFKFTLFFAGFIGTSVLAFLIANYQVPQDWTNSTDERDLLILAIALGSGLVGGGLAIVLFFLGLFLLGASLGILIFTFFVIVTHQAGFFVSHLPVLYSFFSVCGAIGGIVCLIFQRFLITLATSCGGAFGVMIAVDYFAEQGRALAILEASFSNRTLEPIGCWFTYMTVVIWPTLTLVGIIVQYRWTAVGYDHTVTRIRYRKINDEVEMLQPLSKGYEGDDGDEEYVREAHRAKLEAYQHPTPRVRFNFPSSSNERQRAANFTSFNQQYPMENAE